MLFMIYVTILTISRRGIRNAFYSVVSILECLFYLDLWLSAFPLVYSLHLSSSFVAKVRQLLRLFNFPMKFRVATDLAA